MTERQIANALKVSTATITSDLKREAARRFAIQHARAANEADYATEYYAMIGRKAMRIAETPKFPGDVNVMSTAVKARERIDKIRGIDAPVKVDAGIDGLVAALSARNESKEK